MTPYDSTIDTTLFLQSQNILSIAIKKSINMVQLPKSLKFISDGPEHITITSSGTPIENSPFNLTCSANCLHGCTSYRWYFNRTLLNNQTLKFHRLSKTENGEYICYIKDYFGTTAESYSLNVQCK